MTTPHHESVTVRQTWRGRPVEHRYPVPRSRSNESEEVGKRHQEARSKRNVGHTERALSGALGGALLLAATKTRLFTSGAAAALGTLLLYRGASGSCPVYRRMGVSTARHSSGDGGVDVQRSITIGRSPDEVYRFWRDPENLPRIMGHFAKVTAEAHHAHWRLDLPLGRRVEWDTQVVDEAPGERIHWRSRQPSELDSEGEVVLTPHGEWGTEVTLRLRFEPPLGKAGRMAMEVARKAPELVAMRALRRCKALMETGEYPVAERAEARAAHPRQEETH